MKSIALYYSENRIAGSLFDGDEHNASTPHNIQTSVVVDVERERMRVAAAFRSTDIANPPAIRRNDKETPTNTELHINIWKVETGRFCLSPAIYMDFGVMFPLRYKTLCLFLPFDIDGEPKDLSDILRTNDQTLGAVFNSDIQVTSRVNDNYCTVSFLNEQRQFYLYKLGETNFKTECFKEGPKGTFVKITINSTPEETVDGCEQVYIRFRIKLKDKAQYIIAEHISNDLLQAAFSKTDLFDVRVNESRVLDSKVKETMKLRELALCQFDKVHMFYMVDTRETVHNGSSLKQDTRILETEQWTNYQPNTSLHGTTFVAYHWKKRRKRKDDDDSKYDENAITNFSVFFSSVYPRVHIGRLAAYLAVAIMIGWCGSMLTYSRTELMASKWQAVVRFVIVIVMVIYAIGYIVKTKFGLKWLKIYRKR